MQQLLSLLRALGRPAGINLPQSDWESDDADLWTAVPVDAKSVHLLPSPPSSDMLALTIQQAVAPMGDLQRLTTAAGSSTPAGLSPMHACLLPM